MMQIHLIAAVSHPGGVIGRDGNLPWPRLPDDMKWFRGQTLRWPVIMGRKTFDSLPGHLPNRPMGVITHKPDDVATWTARCFTSLSDALAAYDNFDRVFIIGGGTIYERALKEDIVDVMWITRVKGVFPGDVKFPEVDWNQWSSDYLDSSKHKGIEYEFWCHERIRNGTSIHEAAA